MSIILIALVDQNLEKLIKHLKKNLHVGVIHIILPNEKMLIFSGKQGGIKATWIIKDWQCIEEMTKHGAIALQKTYAKNLWATPHLINFITLCFQNNLFRFPVKQYYFKNWSKFFRTPFSQDGVFEQFIDQCCADQIGQYRHLIHQTNPQTRILDIGCDGGVFAKFAARNGHHVTALTLSRHHYQKAKNTLQNDIDLGRICLIQNSRPHMFSENQYDVITVFGWLEYMHSFSLPTLLQAVVNNLSENGSAFIHTLFVPSQYHPQSKVPQLLQNYLFQDYILPSVNGFKREAAQCGLELVKTTPMGCGYINHLEKVFDAIQRQTSPNTPCVYSLLYCCACLIAALKTGHAVIAQVQMKHLKVKDNVIRLAI